MKFYADLKAFEEADRITIKIEDREYFLYEQNGKLHIISDCVTNLMVEPCSNNSVNLI